MYERRLDKNGYVVITSFAKEKIPFVLPKAFRGHKGKVVISNYPSKNKKGEKFTFPIDYMILEPYEALVVKVRYL